MLKILEVARVQNRIKYLNLGVLQVASQIMGMQGCVKSQGLLSNILHRDDGISGVFELRN